ncbi:hypothetical protein J6339_11610 [Burkholderia pseudomallei]|nr:hypothetical protein [Burkholderia pseudomallei]
MYQGNEKTHKKQWVEWYSGYGYQNYPANSGMQREQAIGRARRDGTRGKAASVTRRRAARRGARRLTTRRSCARAFTHSSAR